MSIKALYLAHYGLTSLNCVAMLLFLAIFTGAVIWVYRKSGVEYYRYMENLPLQGENKHD